jgi:predicted dehydrogenase
MSDIKIGILGTGLMSGQRVHHFSQVEGSVVAGVCSRELDKAKAVVGESGARAYNDFGAMLADVDAVVIGVPNPLHTQFALQALEAGKHVLVEYPLAISIEEAESLKQAGKSAGVVLMVGNTIIHEARFQYLWNNRERLGKIVSAASRASFYGPENETVWYSCESKRGPMFSSMHYHHIEYYKRFVGPVEWALGREESIPNEAAPGCDRLAGGTLLLGHQGNKTSCIQWYMSIAETSAPLCMWLNGTEGSVTVVTNENGLASAIWNEGEEGHADVFQDQWGGLGSAQDFVDAVDGRMDHISRLDEDIETMKIGLAATASSKDGSIHEIS